jgi:hypothetical protein
MTSAYVLDAIVATDPIQASGLADIRCQGVVMSLSSGLNLKRVSLKHYFTTIFDVHHSLWTCYNGERENRSLHYCGVDYDVHHKEDFCCVVLPNYLNDKENNFWMTNNMARSTQATFQINNATKRSEVHKISWIIGKLPANEHYLKGSVSTTHDVSGRLKYLNVYSFYYGSQIELYKYVNRHDSDDYLDISFVNPNIKLDYLIF